jgi:hypothetical protein
MAEAWTMESISTDRQVASVSSAKPNHRGRRGAKMGKVLVAVFVATSVAEAGVAYAIYCLL